MTTETSPRLYVGTYAKYNSGSIAGKWLNLEDYADKDAFLKACAELHKDEADPEFMFQDFEGFPRSYYSESSVSDELFAWLEMSESDRELLEVYRENVDQDGDLDKAQEAYCGTFDSEAAWAEDYLEQGGVLDEVPEHLRNYFDYEAYARDARIGGDISFVRHDGDVWVFSNH